MSFEAQPDGAPPPAPPKLCPSARCEPGAILLGMIGNDDQVAYVTPAIPITERFVEIAQAKGTPERRFRFAQPCACGDCKYWAAERCQVADHMVEHLEPAVVDHLPKCAIRPDCRWFDQSGVAACQICPLVVRDLPAAATPREAREAREA